MAETQPDFMKYDNLGLKEMDCRCPKCHKETTMLPLNRKINVLKCSFDVSHGGCGGSHWVCECIVCRELFDVGKYDNLISRYNLKRDRKGKSETKPVS